MMRKLLLSLLIGTSLLIGGCTTNKKVEEVPIATKVTMSVEGITAKEDAYWSVLTMSKMLKDAYEYHDPISYDEFYREADNVVENLEIYRNEFENKDILFKDNHKDLYNCITLLYNECFVQFDDMNNSLNIENLNLMEKSVVDSMKKLNRFLEGVS